MPLLGDRTGIWERKRSLKSGARGRSLGYRGFLCPGCLPVGLIPVVRTGLLVTFVLSLWSLSIAAPAPTPTPVPQGLWMTDGGDLQIVEVPPGQLASSTPTQVVNQSAAISSEPLGLCFDRSNNLWVVDNSTGLLKFTAAQVAALKPGSIAPTPVAVITSTPYTFPWACAFDRHGNFWTAAWVTSASNGTAYLIEFSAAQLANAVGGTGQFQIPPAVVISDVSEFQGIASIAFDPSGNLWISIGLWPSGLEGVLLKFGAAQLTSSGNKLAAVKISDNGGSLYGPGQLAFDNYGNAWVANEFSKSYPNAPTVVRFNSAQLALSGNPKPAVVLSSANFTAPVSLAFQRTTGALWVKNVDTNTLIELPASQIQAGGSPKPGVISHVGGVGSYQMTFGPALGTPGHVPEISSFMPGEGAAGTDVMILGSGFTGTESVTFDGFGGLSGGFTVESDTVLDARVPTGASSGPIAVSNPAGLYDEHGGFRSPRPEEVCWMGRLVHRGSLLPRFILHRYSQM